MSVSKRSSVELSSAASETKRANQSQLKIARSVIAQLQKVAEQEEKELFVYSVREELMKRVMDEIHRRYLERQAVKFTVHCAHKALLQVLKTEFCAHDKGLPYYASHPDWTPDREPEPSHPDSWAAHNVRIHPLARQGSSEEDVSIDLNSAYETGVGGVNDGHLTVLYVERWGQDTIPSSWAENE